MRSKEEAALNRLLRRASGAGGEETSRKNSGADERQILLNRVFTNRRTAAVQTAAAPYTILSADNGPAYVSLDAQAAARNSLRRGTVEAGARGGARPGLMETFLDFVRGLKNRIAIRLSGSERAMLDEAERTLVNLLRGEAGSVAGEKYSFVRATDAEQIAQCRSWKPRREREDDMERNT